MCSATSCAAQLETMPFQCKGRKLIGSGYRKQEPINKELNDAMEALRAQRTADEKAYIRPIMHDSQYLDQKQPPSEPLPGQQNQ